MVTRPTRGERANNPGNIDYHARIPWVGQVGIEILPVGDGVPRFARFDTPEHGIRALAKQLLHYQSEGLNTIRKIIEHWAPPTENKTLAYMDAVSRDTGFLTDAVLDLTDTETLQELVRAIIKFENGEMIYSDSTVADGVEMALA